VYPDKFIRDNVVAPFVLLSIVAVTLPLNSARRYTNIINLLENFSKIPAQSAHSETRAKC